MGGARLGMVPPLVMGRREGTMGPTDLGGRGGLELRAGGCWKLEAREASEARCDGLWLS